MSWYDAVGRRRTPSSPSHAVVRRRTPPSTLDPITRTWAPGPVGRWPPSPPVATSAPTNAAAATVPLTVTNAGGPGALHLYVLGTDLTTGRQGYVTSAGRFTPWSLPTADGETAAPDVSIDEPASVAQLPISLPRNVSGRLYFSYGAPLWLGLTRGGLVQPEPWNAGDPNAFTLMDWSEFTYDAGGLWLNSSQVDQVAIPHEVSVTGTDGSTRRTGGLSSSRYAAAVAEILAAPGFGRTAMYAGNGSLLRVLSPGKATATGRMDPAYLNPAIEAAWSGSAGVIRIAPFGGDPARIYVGGGMGSQMTFTDSTGRPVAAFSTPTSLDVWECARALTPPNDAAVGPIARTLCAALHRGTLGSGVVEPVTDPATFYRAAVSDHYAAAIHAAMSDHLAYGFAFDDVANQESLVHDPNPVSAGIVLRPGTGAAGAVSPSDAHDSSDTDTDSDRHPDTHPDGVAHHRARHDPHRHRDLPGLRPGLGHARARARDRRRSADRRRAGRQHVHGFRGRTGHRSRRPQRSRRAAPGDGPVHRSARPGLDLAPVTTWTFGLSPRCWRARCHPTSRTPATVSR